MTFHPVETIDEVLAAALSTSETADAAA
jgi:hypothetical protein